MVDLGDWALYRYEHGGEEEDLEFLKEAEAKWREAIGSQPAGGPDASSLPAGIADMCFFTRNISRRRGDFAGQQIWHARAMTMAALTQSLPTFARLLLPQFFILLEERRYEQAREVLSEMLWLVDQDHSKRHEFEMHFEEKTGHAYFFEGRFDEAKEHYEQALRLSEPGSRAQLKIRGGLALSGYLALRDLSPEDMESRKDHFVTETGWVATEARKRGHGDVMEAAECNLRMMRALEFENWCPYQLT